MAGPVVKRHCYAIMLSRVQCHPEARDYHHEHKGSGQAKERGKLVLEAGCVGLLQQTVEGALRQH